MVKLSSWLMIFLFCISGIQAQESRYIVYFADKENNQYSLEAPEEFFSSRSLSRRERQGIELDFSDLPVSEVYLQTLESAGITPFYPSKWLNAVIVQVTPDRIPEIEAMAFVERVELGSSVKRLVTGREFDKLEIQAVSQTADTHFDWHGINAMQQEGAFGEGMLIAILDGGFAGVNQAAPFLHLQERILLAENLIDGTGNIYTWSAHGTRVLSIIAARSPGIYTGISPDSEFVLFITEDPYSESRIEEYTWTVGAEKADSTGADIINSSLGYNLFDDPQMDYSYNDMDGKTTMISRMANIAASKGMLVVASAGNSGSSSWKYLIAPADAENVLAVGAVDADSLKASFSSFGPTADGRIKPDVVSLGVGTPQLDQNGDYSPASGTSFSAPVITGYASLLWTRYPYLSSLELLGIIRNAGHNSIVPDNSIGWGIPGLPVIQSSDGNSGIEISIFPNPARTELVVRIAKNMPDLRMRVLDTNGRLVLNGQSAGERIDISGLASGIHILEISYPGGIVRKKFIKY